ncbi:MAG: aminodeoxychorismate/anthranilate synthase component II [Chitinophagales bacterium]|nr:aminodeoxychorismate/anthranilate synthase component II [Chitinophagales bacterium]MCZ2392421.1 aminodeoxychorismate/anthranilate synthase component II [Chitinophagales bacterium]
MKILMLDNYDSFTYNIVHYLEALGAEVDVFRNDKISLEEVNQYQKIVLSPGPGIPSEAGIMMNLIQLYAQNKSILGVCLGHQAIGQAFGAELYNVGKVIHGKAKNTIVVKDDILFKGLPEQFLSGRYHSWAIKNLPDCLELTATDEDGLVQAIRHKEYDVRGVQFHPESILTDFGMNILSNWLNTEKS